MPPRLDVSTQSQTATKRTVLCSGFVGLSFLAVAGIRLLQRIHAAENTLPARQVSATFCAFDCAASSHEHDFLGRMNTMAGGGDGEGPLLLHIRPAENR